MEYLGRAGIKLKTPFKNLHAKGNSPNGISFSVLIIVDKTNLAVFTDLQMSSLPQNENTLLNTQYLFWWLPESDQCSVDDNIV